MLNNIVKLPREYRIMMQKCENFENTSPRCTASVIARGEVWINEIRINIIKPIELHDPRRRILRRA